ncbi:uncharacterized protein LDX57_002864 [Aspergillus melleus]|uniref:uncharacterized protein n=1 Tax=Aspergillus melleus TaxID=138277 RepID=UPI001E8E318D|nr:uncharacterized protein LDX57_002864 [Aspergillus melleus]KAH8425115.1 hypothetical protein LDX57_002864 [Aspergillus melleus]
MANGMDKGTVVGVSVDQPHEVTPNISNRDALHQVPSPTKDSERASDPGSLQAGVQRADILRNTWSKQGLITAFVGYESGSRNRRPSILITHLTLHRLFLATLAINFGDYATQVYVPYTTSAFKQHSAMSAARVVMNITRISAYPIIAKLGDV